MNAETSSSFKTDSDLSDSDQAQALSERSCPSHIPQLTTHQSLPILEQNPQVCLKLQMELFGKPLTHREETSSVENIQL